MKEIIRLSNMSPAKIHVERKRHIFPGFNAIANGNVNTMLIKFFTLKKGGKRDLEATIYNIGQKQR